MKKLITIFILVTLSSPSYAMSKKYKVWADNLASNFAIAKTMNDFCPDVKLNKEVFLSKMAQIYTKAEENYFFERIDFHAEDLMAYLRSTNVKKWCEDQYGTLKDFKNSEVPVFFSKPPSEQAPQG
jgi:hypothetical protein